MKTLVFVKYFLVFWIVKLSKVVTIQLANEPNEPK